jgi:replication factor C subunit 1
MKVPANVIDQLITGSQSDIRQVLTMLSTWKLSSDTMTFDEGKDLYVSHSASFLSCSLTVYLSAFPTRSSGLTRALNCWLLTAFHVRFHRLRINEKYTIMSPFDITQKLLGPSLFSHTSRETLGDKIELYFQDHSFMPLFVQVGGPRLTHLGCGMYSTLFPSPLVESRYPCFSYISLSLLSPLLPSP